MDLTKKDVDEIIDGNSNLIGTNGIPTNGPNKETQASKTTDYNYKVGTQPFRYDMLGRFGFSLMPFLEEGEMNDGQTNLVNDLSKLAYDNKLKILEYYYRHPNKLKSDYRKLSETDYESIPDEFKNENDELAKSIIDIFQPHFEKAFKEPEVETQINEVAVVEDKVLEKKSETEMSKKSEVNDVTEKKIEKIAGLINTKLNKQDLNKLINLLEKHDG